MEKSVNTISYKPLPVDGTQIRLVAILPGRGSEVVECIVDNYPFIEDEIDDLEYEALSYVWGDPTTTTAISLNGQPFQATTNLEAALRALRFQDDERLIWTDAICINQTSVEERNQEVRRMGDIYRHAERVIIWLGRELEPGDIPVQGPHIASLTVSLLNLLANTDPEDPDAGAIVLVQTGNVMHSLQLLLRFFSRPWFLRVWILQEIALAKTATVIYGGRWIRWERLSLAVDALRRLQNGQNTHIWRLTGASRADKVLKCRMRAHDASQRGLPEPSKHNELCALLWQTRFCECTEPRDRLYGILGMVKGDLSNENLLEIDYSKSVADVFRDLSIFMLQHGMLSNVLCSVANPVDGMPSWATTWSTPLDGDPRPNGLAASRLSDGINVYLQIHQLRGTVAPPNPPRFSADFRHLTLKGRIFDAFGVWHIGKRFAPNDDDPDLSIDEQANVYRRRLIEWEDEMEGKPCAHEKLKTEAERREAWKLALLHETTASDSEMCRNYDMLTDREKELPLAKDTALIMSTVVTLKTTLGSNFEYRRPFITMLGVMGSTGTNCDVHFQDQVCVFVGSAVPYLLRPVDPEKGQYRFLGCCWVTDFIDMDIVEGVRRGYWELKDITLV
ncbi:HET-domain-containing protein [Pleurostoma richardsiae]|uniref:HET-domain-containing protein n=1 Tax=Pleurostoma richardsiae TaxID=41990 RepID=A0AA38VXA3_9PEZI|nr:HET-domain-containing protein [Pleurostoma richardsiae]